jgi:hypothetical protein
MGGAGATFWASTDEPPKLHPDAIIEAAVAARTSKRTVEVDKRCSIDRSSGLPAIYGVSTFFLAWRLALFVL